MKNKSKSKFKLDPFDIFLWLALIICVCIFLYIILGTEAEALQSSNSIGVTISNTCFLILKANMTGCPSIDNLLEFGLDTSKKESGSFIIKDGITRRDNPIIPKHYKLYDLVNDYNIFIEPDYELEKRVKMIRIEKNFDIYLSKLSYKKINNTRILGVDRYIDSCFSAVINEENWQKLLSDTIYFMRNDCKPNYTNYNSIIKVVDPTVEHDITTSKKYQYDLWVKESKEKYKEYRIGKD